MQFALIVAALVAGVVVTQDPAPGWLAYATAQCPAGTRITHMEAKWLVGQNPPQSFAFFSPWFGIDTTDNLNLLQPVNPWLGTSWSMYTEYYQWSPTHNKDSAQYSVNAGDQLFGQITFNGESEQSYTLKQTDVTSGQTSEMVIPVQVGSDGQHKNYTVQYIVYEKVAQCNQYPPDQKVVFNDIKVFCNGVQVAPQWTTGIVENVCDFKATPVSSSQVEITWNIDGVPPTQKQLERAATSAIYKNNRIDHVAMNRAIKKEMNIMKEKTN
ncbi:peptidase, putative [Bodo saltans]|uniref:Peptidase, putative n=1 Tax=Bodo saltans TaxID=75058 RepID=A0A0S4JY87_BODSA|nr:peptidase, putative [Bodo saltans]|eukprot:CUG94109.1 peptidase, putative [Bodo saltans]